MKAFLMYKDRDFDPQRKLPWNEQALIQDLELNALFNAMALGDKFLFEVAKSAILCSLNDIDTIVYRQNILRDCLNNSSIVRDIYAIAVEAIENKKRFYFGIFSKYPESILHGSIESLQLFMGILKKLRHVANEHAGKFESEGFTALFAMLKEELADEYFAVVQNHLRELGFREGVLVSAELGEGNKGANYILRKAPDKTEGWLKRLFARKAPGHSFAIADRDEAGARALSELKDRGLNLVANAAARSADHILSFFTILRTELAFYVGCLNLHGQLAEKTERGTHQKGGSGASFPVPVASGERRHSFSGLYDVSLALTLQEKIASNDLRADHKDLVIITGANQGGKSSFLRSIGLSQLMMQCGMFVPAEFFCSNICDGLFTHYKREEDATMTSGKFDEELSRMNDMVNHITSNSLVLFNESFAATNEREGSEIARQIISALIEKGIKVFFVTHLYEFAYGFYGSRVESAIFLRAERQADGTRTFRIIEGEPLQTSYGEDLYDRIFGGDGSTIPA